MITIGSVSREDASQQFPFLSERFRGRRRAIKEFTHRAPEFVFWISPTGVLIDAKDSHRRNPPKGHRSILDDEPDYGGFLRGRIATSTDGQQLVVVYCRPSALVNSPESINQLLLGLERLPVPLHGEALVISDNADIYGTIRDLQYRAARDPSC